MPRCCHNRDEVTRSGIYFPQSGTDLEWFDYWDGSVVAFTGVNGSTLDDYPAPLDTLPLFVRAGAIVPLWPDMNFFDEKPHDPLTLDIWPFGSSSFDLYEDDGITREALDGDDPKFARTMIRVEAPLTLRGSESAPLTASASVSGDNDSDTSGGNVTITVSAFRGAGFKGQLAERSWRLQVRVGSAPLAVLLNDSEVQACSSEASFEAAEGSAWYFDAALQGGLVLVKTTPIPNKEAFQALLMYGQAHYHVLTDTCDAEAQNPRQAFSLDPDTGRILATAMEGSPCLTVGVDLDADSHTPAIELQTCVDDKNGTQIWALRESGQVVLMASGGASCLDQDVSVNRLIAYACHDADAAGNQAWNLASGDAISSVTNGLCATASTQKT